MSNCEPHSVTIFEADNQYERKSEASIVSLGDSTLLLGYTSLRTEDDFSEGTLTFHLSYNNGRCWDEGFEPFKSKGDYNVLSPSFLYVDSLLYVFFIKKFSEKLTKICYATSFNGLDWSNTNVVSDKNLYYVVNNDRVIRLSNGRIIVPYAVTDDIFINYDSQTVGFYFSDDKGQSWQSSDQLSVSGPAMEPGVVELEKGSLLSVIRTKLGSVYFSNSFDFGQSWDKPYASGLRSPEAPSTIKKISNSNRLIIVWNNRSPSSERFLDDRKSLSYSLSDVSEINKWSEPKLLEEDSLATFSYVSILNHNENLIFTYYKRPEEMKSLRHLVARKMKLDEL